MRKMNILIVAATIMMAVTGSRAQASERPVLEQSVEAVGAEEQTDGTYNYTINADGKTATLTKYIGSAADVTIPEAIGNGYTVTKLGQSIFINNTLITHVYIPKTVTQFGLYTTEFSNASNLTDITVSKENPLFYDEDGVLFEKVIGGILLVKYPEGKKDSKYMIPKSVTYVNEKAFRSIASLSEIRVPDTTKKVYIQAFSNLKADIIFAHLDASSVEIEYSAFNYLKDGSRVIVRDAELKSAAEKAMRSCTNTTVINLADLPAEEQKDYLIPTTSLTWDGTNTTGSTTLKPGEKCQLNYQQLPANSTDNVRWSSSDPAVAKVDAVTGLIEASGGVNYGLKTGTTTITGTDESAHSITLEVTVHQAVTSMEFYYPKNGTMTIDYVPNLEKTVSLDIMPVTANNADNIIWSSSNALVATAIRSETKKGFANGDTYVSYGTVTILSPGTTTITATLNDNGVIFTKSFVLTITNAANAGEGTDNNSGNNSGNGGTTPGNDSSKDNDGNTDGTISTPPTHTQPIKTYIEKGKITPTTITLTYGTTAKIRIAAKGRTTCFVTNKKIAVLTSSGKLVPKNTGVTTLKVKADASGKYKGRTITYRLIVLPKKETVTYAKSLKAGQFTLKWKKDTRATGYQVQYSTSSKFAKKATKTILVKNSRIAKKTIQKLSGGKKYYVRVRAYKTMKINGKKTNRYGAWSRRKAVTIN